MPAVAPPRIQIPVNTVNLDVSIFYLIMKVMLCNMSLSMRVIQPIDASFLLLQRSDVKVITEQSCGLTKKRKFPRPGNIVNMLQMQKVFRLYILCILRT